MINKHRLMLGMWAIKSSAMASESAILSDYLGVVGTAPSAVAITSAGAALQQGPNNAQGYLFFSQTLVNRLYYELRIYGAYNYMTQNPIFPSVAVSNIQNPPGWGGSGFLGYNFHASETLDITPYVRINYLKNMLLVYEDSNGNYINSVALSGYLGGKFSFKLIKGITPYINFWAGYQQVALTGNLEEGAMPGVIQTATVDQLVANTELGISFKASTHINLIPYYDYQTTANYPDSVAMNTPTNGGFGVTAQTGVAQFVGMKMNISW